MNTSHATPRLHFCDDEMLRGEDCTLLIVDSAAFKQESVLGIPARYVPPTLDGRIPLADRAFDLITAFGVLHHVPNVSFVVGELARTLGRGGYLLIREPIVSMGDWRKPRPHLTKHERGIPLKMLQSIVRNSGLDIVRIGLCGFPLVQRAFGALGIHPRKSRLATSIDAIASNLMSWNVNYHARSFIQKLRPTSAFVVARMP